MWQMMEDSAEIFINLVKHYLKDVGLRQCYTVELVICRLIYISIRECLD